MQTSQITAQIDEEIARLKQIKTLLTTDTVPAKRGRKPGTAASSASTTNGNAAEGRKRRELSSEARAKIAAAQKKRWAKARRAAKSE